MIYYANYDSDLLGTLVLASDGEALVGCWFYNDRFFGYGVDEEMELRPEDPVLTAAIRWLDRYFAGEKPSISEFKFAARGSVFQHKVWNILTEIPYGETWTYGDIAKRIAAESGKKMSAQAVGGAVGHNPIAIIVPCHRVMGAKGNLTGFGGGIDTKIKLLEHERVNMEGFYVPKKGTALDAHAWSPHEHVVSH